MGVTSINHNIAALNALNALAITDASLSRSIERLASGLRINRAADDAAGLTISERLRAQIRGLDRAAANAQDGISLIQTAEGAMNEVSSILQRMRELAVQAANGVLTTNDRQEIQKEINQLTDEINRIGQTTEFNTKTLLDGTIGALISTDDPTATKGVVVGDVGKGGNFILQKYLVEAPTLQVQKSSPFNTIAGEDRVGIVNGEYTFLPTASIQDGAASTIGITDLVVQPTANGSVAMSLGTLRVTLDATVGVSNGTTLVSTINSHNLTAGDYISITGRDSASVAFTATYTITAASDWQSIANWLSSALVVTAGSGQVTVDATQVSFSGLEISVSTSTSVNLATFTFVDADNSGSELDYSIDTGGLLVGGSAQTANLVQEISVSVQAGGSTWSGTIHDGNVNTIGDANVGEIQVAFDSNVFIGVGNTDVISVARSGGRNELQFYGNVTQISTPEDNYTFRITALTATTYRVENLTTGSVATNTGSILELETDTSLLLDSLRGIQLSFDPGAMLQAGETAIFHSSTNNVLVAQNDTTLASISRFRDFGVFDGRDSLQLQLNYGGNGETATVIVNATDTIEVLEAKISLAIANPATTTDLDLEGGIRSGNAPDLVHYNLTGPAQGTFSIVTPDPSGELVFAGDEKLLNALGLVDIEQYTAPVYSVTAINIHTGENVGSIRTNTNLIQGLLPGVDVVFDTTVGFNLDADPGTAAGTYGNNFSYDRSDLEGTLWASDDPNKTGVLPFIQAYERPTVSIVTTGEEEFIHIAPRAMELQIGPNQGQTIAFTIEQMDAFALGLESVLVVNPELAQEAITRVDDAINRVASQRAKLGAIQNRLESTIRNLNVTMENLTAAESRIRDLNIAQQTIDFTRDQILLQAGTAVLAQANQLPNVVLSLLQ